MAIFIIFLLTIGVGVWLGSLMFRAVPNQTSSDNSGRFELLLSHRPNLTTEINWSTSAPHDYVVIDLETTGLDPCVNEIVEIGAVKYINDKQVDIFSTYIKPIVPISSKVTKINHITNEMLQNAPDLDSVTDDFFKFIEGFTLIAHNAKFDVRFLQIRLMLPRFSYPVIDTLDLSKRFIKDVPDHKLETLKKYFSLDVASHSAVDDCITAAHVYQFCRFGLEEEIRRDEVKKQHEIMQKKQIHLLEIKKSLDQMSNSARPYYNAIRALLEENDRDARFLNCNEGGTNIILHLPGCIFLELKLTGRLTYVLVDSTFDLFDSAQKNGLDVRPASKAEGECKCRLMIKSPDDIAQYKDFILRGFDLAYKKFEDLISR